MSVGRVVKVVLAVAALGLVLGAGFGWAAGHLAPAFFTPWTTPAGQSDPVGAAVVLGAFGGLLCGGALGAFALFVHALTTNRSLTIKEESTKVG
ncbi:MAG: hypothetical protein ACKN9U_04515 [Pirellulaceae bacterium]|jgi:hypothetical protein